MRNVFVHYKNNQYYIIDKATDQLFEKINDVLLFNATYKRYKSIKGWHGILSEEINTSVIKLLEEKFYPLVYIPKTYYPRLQDHFPIPFKDARFLRLQDGKESSMSFGQHMNSSFLQLYIEPWVSKIEDDEYDNDEDYDDYTEDYDDPE